MHNRIIRNRIVSAVLPIAAIVICVAIALSTMNCTQYMAKHGGGTMTVQLPPDTRLITVTWKEAELWYLVRPRTADEKPVTWTFKEKSTLGIQEGTVLLVER